MHCTGGAVLGVFPGRPCVLRSPLIFARLVHGSFTPSMKDSGDPRTSVFQDPKPGSPLQLPTGRKHPGRVRRFLALSPADRKVLLGAFFLLPLTAAGLRVIGYRRLRGFFESLLPGPPSVALDRVGDPCDAARRAAQMVDAAAREGLRSGTCLERSLVLWWLLRRRGIPAELRIGARKNASIFEAHAWVELDGAVVNDSGEVHRHYAPFDEIGAAAPGKTR